jgi:hypothetical protein
MIGEWIKHPNTYELESSFGGPRGIEMTDFLSVIKRLKARFGGDAELKQEDRLTITLKDHTRFTIVDAAQIKKFCSDNRIVGKKYIAITKESTGKESDVNIPDYGVHIKTRSEVPMNEKQIQMAVQGWEQKDKAFRLITRWTFEDDDLKFDASVVYSTPKVRVGDGNTFAYKWAKTYRDYDIKSNAPVYEIEVELKHSEKTHDPTYALTTLIRGVGEVLRGIQKSPVLIRQPIKERVLEDYKELLGQSDGRALFRGNPPKTLLYKNILPLDEQEDEGSKDGKVSLYDGYNVTDKADGLRVLVYCDKSGELFLIDMSMEVYRTGLRNETCRDSLLDAEWVTMNKQNQPIQQLCIFDVFIVKGKDISQLPFYTEEDESMRHLEMTNWVVRWNEPESMKDLLPVKVKNPDGSVSTVPRVGSLKVAVKKFLFASAGDKSIFYKAGEMLQITENEDYTYHTDGLIFTPNASPLPDKPGATFYEQFKWKPANDNTIDFLAEAVADPRTKQETIFVDVKDGDSSIKRYKQYTLSVKVSSDPILMNPRDSVLNEKGLPESMLPGRKTKIPIRKVPFDPDEFPDKYASVCKIPLLEDQDYAITESGEPIQSNIIIEMRYDVTEPDPTWRWKPLRIRHDKTARYAAALKATKGKGIGQRTLNGFDSAMDVWISIHRPITKHMITTGETEPDSSEVQSTIQPGDASINRYYQNSAPLESKQLIQSMANFHNYFIKEAVLLQPSLHKAPDNGKTLIDLAVGQGSDIGRWSRAGVNFVLGIDKAGFGIVDRKKGAYRRYINQKVSIAYANFNNEKKYKEQLAKGRQAKPFNPIKMADMIFVEGDSSKYVPDGASSGDNKDDANILRVLFGNSPRESVPKLVNKHVGAFKEGSAVTAMMFALHYMFQSPETFEGFLQNLDATVKIGGYFVGCCFDGETVFNLLSGVSKGQSVERKITRNDGTPVEIWSIKRNYDEDEFAQDETGFGKAIDVRFLSIGATHTEYLVPFQLLEKKLKTIGLRLLNAQERKDMILNLEGKKVPMSTLFDKSTSMFKDTWEKAKDEKGNQLYGMEPQVMEFSFLNRWFIFKRDNKKSTEEEDLAVNPSTMAQNLRLPGQAGGGDENTKEEALPASDGLGKKEYEINDVFQFHLDAPMNDRFKIGDKTAARWLAPIARFPIYDENDNEYPSLDHYIAAMRYKYGAKTKDNKEVPNEFLQAMFGPEGSIHQRALRAEIRERGDKNIDDEQLKVILKEEYDDIQKQVKPAAIKANGFISEEGEWSKYRDRILRDGIKQRWENDEKFRKAVIALHKQNKHLLYYNPLVGMSYYAGMRRANKTIEGDNMVGRIIMQLAGYSA